MKLALVGPIDGNLKKLDSSLPNNIDWCLSSGSVGIWPFLKFMDKPSKQYCSQDFSELYPKFEGLKHKVLFVRGPHDDNFWINRQLKAKAPEFLPNLVWLSDGYKTILNENLKVTGLGGTYSEHYFNTPYKKKIKLKSYRRQHIEKACSSGKTDILLLHVDPREGKGIDLIIDATLPRLIVHTSKYNKYEEHSYRGVLSVGLANFKAGIHICDITKETICLQKL